MNKEEQKRRERIERLILAPVRPILTKSTMLDLLGLDPADLEKEMVEFKMEVRPATMEEG